MAIRRRLGSGFLRRSRRQRLPDPGQADLRAFDRTRVHAEALHRHVTALCQWRRSRQHPDEYAAAARHIESTWSGLGLDVVRETVPGAEADTDAGNLIVRLGPEGGPRVVVGAHYDAWFPDDASAAALAPMYPGADDNASGVAVLLELARVLREAPLRRGIDLVAFADEEPPRFGTDAMGSAVRAAALRASGVHVRAMVSLEMLGCFRDEPGSQDAPAGLRPITPTVGDFIAVVGDLRARRVVRDLADGIREAGFPAHGVAAPAFVGGIDLSDHASFAAHGWPACMVTDTGPYRNERYHQPTDTPETLDYRRMARLAEALAAALPLL